VTHSPEGGQDSSIAAMVSAVADGYPADADEKAVLELALITRLLEGKATWAQIGAVQGISGREAKRRAHKLRLRVQRSVLAATGEGLGCGNDDAPRLARDR
jgi:hypothetical protein